MQSIYWENPVFEESIMNPVLLAMATYLCGYGVILSAMGCWMKGPNYSNFNLTHGLADAGADAVDVPTSVNALTY